MVQMVIDKYNEKMNAWISKDILTEFITMNPQEQKEFMRTKDYRRAIEIYRYFHPIQKQVIYGKNLVSKLG